MSGSPEPQLERVTIPREWLLLSKLHVPLQRFAAAQPLMTFLADTAGFAEQDVADARAMAKIEVRRLIGEHFDPGGDPDNPNYDQVEKELARRETATHTYIVYYVDQARHGEDTDVYIVPGLYALVEIYYYDDDHDRNDVDPDDIFYTALRWDQRWRQWRLPRENWALAEGVHEDHNAPQAIQVAHFTRLAYGNSPDLYDVLRLQCGGAPH